MRVLAYLAFICTIQCAFSARILIVPVQGKSHMLSTNVIGQELKKNGHEVFTVAEDNYKGKENQLGATDLEVLYFHVPEGSLGVDSEHYQRTLMSCIINGTDPTRMLGATLFASCQNMLRDTSLLDKIASLKFDLAIVETMPLLPCGYLLPHIFKIPHISVSPGLFPTMIPGSATLPSFCSGLLAPFKNKFMTFTERLQSILINALFSRQVLPLFGRLTGLLKELSDFTLIEEFRAKGLVSDNIQEWYDFFDETQLFIIKHTGLTLGYPTPYYPNVIPVEGLSISDAKPLPPDVTKLIESADHGVVVVSFGSNVKYLPEEIVTRIVNVFRKRKELFLMRYSEKLKDFDMPSNVRFMSWLPQNDLIAHSKTKLFITHGGANGLHEAIYQGVPLLCVPLFGDQFGNALKLEGKGFGLSFKLTDFSEDEVLGKIDELITNPKYRKNSREAGLRMKSQPMNPRQTAAFWIEHVLQFGGEHLKPSSVELTWWQYFCLDTLGTIGLVVFLVFWFIHAIFKCVFKVIMRIISPARHEKRE